MSYPGNYLHAPGPPRSGTPARFMNEQMRELLKPKDGAAGRRESVDRGEEDMRAAPQRS